ncbi:hypothetical protein [Mesorhizobium sp. Cs1321R2N1]|uniref:hypothetical protein n=1 Tax=Mesorhizobium sp. Cs1321R2N1 TaxID=3015174 RepID=UPI00301BE8D5
MRWTIKQFFRTLKRQGLQLEDSQLETAERLMRLTAIAARAACIIMQLVQARDGASAQPAEIVFTLAEIDTLQALVPDLEGKTALQKNPRPPRSLAWAAWVIAKLGGGMAIRSLNRQAQSPSATVFSTSNPSPMAGACEMCESPSRCSGVRRAFLWMFIRTLRI